ncbi:hypothetical protein ANN_11836 [Periplaneta americana]|uniref:Uncharacterized protein n=1 Tax=Periplaneta americana TaxID=6978 RepID=A0ABQ8T659_PERAM|nr:hypothetical protein ANN_11836 [Periplaneta americana]
MGESRNAYRVLVGRPEGKISLGRPRRRREDNIKMYLREVGYDDRDWINLAQDRDGWRAYVRAAMNLRSLMLAGSEFQSLGRAIVKEDEYEEVRWDGIVSIVSWRERVFRLWWEESSAQALTELRLSSCFRDPDLQNEPRQRSGPGGDMWRDYIRQDGPMQSRCGTPTSEREDREDSGSDGLTCLPKRRGNNGRGQQRTEFCGKN